jgi:hypothetical protein
MWGDGADAVCADDEVTPRRSTRRRRVAQADVDDWGDDELRDFVHGAFARMHVMVCDGV